MRSLPRVQVLQFEPSLTHSIWKDYFPRNRSIESLRKALRKEVSSGRFVGYRLINVHEEQIGNP